MEYLCPTIVARFASISHNYFMSDGLIVYFALSVMLILRDIYFNSYICSFCLPSENTTWTCTVCLFLITKHWKFVRCAKCQGTAPWRLQRESTRNEQITDLRTLTGSKCQCSSFIINYEQYSTSEDS